ncbi:hypothetical protein BDV12DRAFT_174955 [Aspergillus spectabilis]
MPQYSKIVVTALALISIAGVTTAAPALGMGLRNSTCNETMSILANPVCSNDTQCDVGSVCDSNGGDCV